MSKGHVFGTEENITTRLKRLEAENAALRARIAKSHLKMTDDKDISLTASDVFHETSPRIAKPPNYHESNYEHDDDVGDAYDGLALPPQERDGVRNDDNVNASAKQDETDGGGEDVGSKKTPPSTRDGYVNADDDIVAPVIPLLDSDVVVDALDKVTTTTALHTKGDEKNVEEHEKGGKNDECDGGAGGGNDEDEKRAEPRGSADSWILLNKDGEKIKDMDDGDYNEENVTELVDRVESALEATSKEERGAFDSLVAVLRILLPLILFMADELKMLKDKVKDLILHNRSLQKEVRRTHQEAEKRNREKEMVSVGVTAMIQEDIVEKKTATPSPRCRCCQDKLIETNRREAMNVSDDDNVDEQKVEAMKKELKKLRYQCRELQQVNHSWEKYTQKQSARHIAEMKKRESELAAAEQKRKRVEKRLEDKFKEYDQTLLHVREMEKQHKTAASQYKKDRDTLRPKYEETKILVRELIKDSEDKDVEIKRLNAVIERKIEPKTHKAVKKPDVPIIQQARVIDEEYGAPVRKIRSEKYGTTAAPAALAAAQPEVYRAKYAEKEKQMRSKQPRDRSMSPPLSPRGPPVYENPGGPMSLTSAELKDQVLLYKEQIDLYRSDFNQERRDREKAVGHVDSLKKELEKTKMKLKEIQRKRKQEEHNLYATARQLGHLKYLPEDTQEMRLREIKQQAKGGRRYQAYGRQYADEYDLPEGHLYADIE